MKKLLFTIASVCLFSSVLFVSCTKDDTTGSVAVIQRPNINRTVDYTVLVVAGENSSTSSLATKSAQGALEATVSVSVNGKVLTQTTDASGQATFTGLTAGIAAVTVSMANHTTANLVVDIYHIDSIMYDNESKRMASTKVILLPLDAANMITVSGMVNVQSDITVFFDKWITNNSSYKQSPELELANGAVITATISQNSLSNLVTMIDGGSVKNVTYENVSYSATVGADGKYSITLPATAQGVNYTLYPNDYESTVNYSAFMYDPNTGTVKTNAASNYLLQTVTERYVYTASSSSVSAISGRKKVIDFTYNTPIITNPDYFGSSAYQD